MHLEETLRRALARALPLLALCLAPAPVACGGDDRGAARGPEGEGEGSDAAAPDPAAPDSGGASDGGGEPWEELLTAEWSLEPGTEKYVCARVTATEDAWIRGFRAISPLGTHHSVLYLDPPLEDGSHAAPDGVEDCSGSVAGTLMAFGAGVGTDAFLFPAGVGARIRAGTQMFLNLHVYDVTDEPITATSGVEVLRASEDQVGEEVELVLAGKIPTLQVPPGESTQTGTCTVSGDHTLFAIMPHMHQYGTHMRTVLHTAAGETSIVDRPYDFDDQPLLRLDTPLELHDGDSFEVNCSYRNPTANTVGFGSSSDQEMCFTDLYWYPPAGRGPFCFND